MSRSRRVSAAEGDAHVATIRVLELLGEVAVLRESIAEIGRVAQRALRRDAQGIPEPMLAHRARRRDGRS